MIQLTETLSKDIPFVRVDFYEIEGRLYFGVLPFYPSVGRVKFIPRTWDSVFGLRLQLPKSDDL